MTDKWTWNSIEMAVGGKGGNCFRKILFQCHLQHHHSRTDCPEIDPPHLRWADARNCMSSDTAIYCYYNVTLSYILAGRATWAYVGNTNGVVTPIAPSTSVV